MIKRPTFSHLNSISVFLCCGFFSLTACKEPAKLPPSSSGVDSSPAKIFCDYKDWDFGEKAYSHTKNILDFGPRPIESEGHKDTQTYITETLTDLGWVVKPQEFETTTPYGKRKFTNHIARYKGTDSPSILLAAHYDSKLLKGFLGADDAASCVGALLEIAEQLPKQDLELAKKIEFIFFDGEEALKKNIVVGKDGLYGSLYYSSFLNKDVTSTKKVYKVRPKFGILLDMIGHKNLRVKIPGDTPYSLLKTYMKVAEDNQLQDQFTTARGTIADDHYFMNEVAKVPTIDIIGDFNNPVNKWWHTSKDNFSNISKKSLSTSIQFTLEMLKEQDKKSK